MTRKISIMRALIALFLFIVLLPAIIAGFFYAHTEFEHQLHDSMFEERNFNREIRDNIEFESNRFVTILQNNSAPVSYELNRNGHKEHKELVSILIKNILKREPGIHGLIVVSEKGEIISAYDQVDGNIISLEKPSASSKGKWLKEHWGLEWEENIRSPEFVVSRYGRVYISPPKLHEGRYMFNIAVPVGNADAEKASFIAEIDLGIFWQNRKRKKGRDDVISYLVDQRGVVVATHNAAKDDEGKLITNLDIVRSILSASEWSIEQVYKGLGGENVYGVSTVVPSLNLSVISEISESFLLAPIKATIIKSTITVLVVLVLFIGMGLWLVKKLLKPVESLSKAMQDFARGEASDIYISNTVIAEFDALGQGFSNMVNERSKIEEEQQFLQNRLLMHREQSPLGIIEWNTKFEPIDWNPAAEFIFGFTKEDVVGRHITSTILPDSASEEIVNHLWKELLAQKGGRYSVNENVTKDGQTILCEWHNTPLVDENGVVVGVSSFVEDITEKNIQEEKLRRSQKMDALGKLTGGIAHDYNNMLNIIIGYSDILKKKLTDDPKLQAIANEINHAGMRNAVLTKKLLSFSSSEPTNAKAVYIDRLINASKDMLQRTLTARIEMVVEVEEDLWPVCIDEGDLEDAILNMSINAMHSIEGNGRISITAKNEYVTEDFAHKLGIDSGNYVRLNISDTGCGMDTETQSHIFEPFYSTKGDKGTGLGLSQVYGFLTRSGGTISVVSEPGKGSQFSIYLPRYYAGNELNSDVATDAIQDGFLFGEETILVVDDEAGLRNLAKEMLEAYGYHIICAEDGQHALTVLENNRIDLVFSDVIMPSMDGFQLAAEIQKRWPEMIIQLTSGFSDDRHIGTDTGELHKNLMDKPYDFSTLLKRVRELLDARAIQAVNIS